ncbi:MAG TPA: hypothetical protein VEB60_01725 [Candidatus Paceibacterota bacterium]|nr:hypothetical protein [Candidatus Paceibacterota bacterium]
MWKKASLIFACILLLAQAAVGISLSKSDSQTSDESQHLYAGYQYWTTSNFRYNHEHPPLMKYLAAFPLLFIDPNMPAEHVNDADPIRSSTAFIYNSGNDPDQLLFWGRMPMVFITLLLGVAIYAISAYLWGFGGGLISLALYVANPLIIGHGHLVTNDMLLSLAVLLALFSFGLFLMRPTWRRAVIFGLVLGLAQISKFSALILFPIVFIALVIHMVLYKDTRETVMEKLTMMFASIIACLLVIVLAYKVAYVGNYFTGLQEFMAHASQGHLSYLLGMTSNTGWWYYFPVMFFFKTPIITMVVIAVACVCAYAYSKRRRRVVHISAFILGSALCYLLFSMASKANIGIRHIMPVYPLLFVFAGIIGNNIYVMLILAMLLIQTKLAYPHFLSYFNEFAGGTSNGYKIGVDSNYDWGQDSKRIRAYIDEHDIQNVTVVYWNGQGADWQPTPGSNLIIGATQLMTDRTFESIKNREPNARITPSVFLYSF